MSLLRGMKTLEWRHDTSCILAVMDAMDFDDFFKKATEHAPFLFQRKFAEAA